MRTSLSEEMICHPRFATSANAFLYAASGLTPGSGAFVLNCFPVKKLPVTEKLRSQAGAEDAADCGGVVVDDELVIVAVDLAGSVGLLIPLALSATLCATFPTVSQPAKDEASASNKIVLRMKIMFGLCSEFKVREECVHGQRTILIRGLLEDSVTLTLAAYRA